MLEIRWLSHLVVVFWLHLQPLLGIGRSVESNVVWPCPVTPPPEGFSGRIPSTADCRNP